MYLNKSEMDVKVNTLLVLSALKKFGDSNWAFSNINKTLTGFNSIILKSSLGEYLLQYRNDQIKRDCLLSTDVKYKLSLARYILSYKSSSLDVNKILIFTTTKLLENDLLVKHYSEELVIFNLSDSYVIRNDFYTQILKNTQEYQNNIPPNGKNKTWKNLLVTHEDIDSFCRKFILIKINEDIIHDNLLKIMEFLEGKFNFPLSNYTYVSQKIKEWYNRNALNCEEMTASYIKAILFGEENRKHSSPTQTVVKFKEQYSFDPTKKILHIKTSEMCELIILKVRQTLSKMYEVKDKSYQFISEEVLFLDKINNFAVIEEIVDCFSLRSYKLLIISLLTGTAEQIKNIGNKIETIVNNNSDKKVIVIANEIFFIKNHVQTITDEISLDSLHHVSKSKILKKPIYFQGEQFSLEDVENVYVDKDLIQELFKKKEYILGKNIKYCNDINTNYIARNVITSKNESFSENELFLRVKKKMLVIVDIAGSGKTNLLRRLAYVLKKSNPSHCVISLDLESINQYLNEKNNNSTFTDYICLCENISSSGKNIIKSLKKHIFVDGVDEVNVKNRTQLIDFLKNNISEIANIVISTKKYRFILQELATVDDFELYSLQTLSLKEQIELGNNYFSTKSSEKLIHLFHQLNCVNLKIPLTPLVIIMLAEMCISETINLNSVKDVNIYEFYNMYYAFLCSNLRTIKNTNIADVLNIFNKLDSSGRIFDIRILVDDQKIKHETFHDYFVIQHLWSLIVQKDKKILKDLLENVFLNKECLSICIFFNYMLDSRKSTHHSTLSAVSNLYNSIIDEISWNQDNNLINLVSNKCLNIIKLIFDKYKHCSKIIGIRDNNGITALHFSIWDQDTFKYFLQKEVDLNNNIDIFCLILLSCSNKKKLLKPSKLIGIKSCLVFLDYIHIPRLTEKQIIDIFTYLKTIRTNINIQDQNECNLLHYAAALNLPDSFKFFKENIQLELLSDKLGHVPQYYAAENNALEIVKYLNTLNTDFNVRDNDGDTLVHVACLNGSLNVLKYLINECKMTLQCSNNDGYTPQHYAAQGNALEIIKYLKTLNVDFNVQNNDGDTLVHIACLNGSLNVLKYLINECEITLHCSNNDGYTPQHYAAEGNALEIIKYLKTLNVDFNVQNNDGDTLVHIACLNGSLNVLKYLINECEITLHCSNNDGYTPQHYAAEGNALEIIKYLKTLNVDFNVQNNDGDTLLHVACFSDSLDVLKFLINECKITLDCLNKLQRYPQHYAIRETSLEVIKYLKKLNVDFNVVDYKYYTPLHIACLQKNSLSVVKYLVEECNLQPDKPKVHGTLPIHLAALRNNLDVLKYLIDDCKVDINVQNEFGSYIQHHAARGNSLDVIIYLRNRNVDLNVKDYKGYTLLHRAAIYESLEVLKYLREDCKMSVNVVSKNGSYPQHHAASGNALKIIEYFIENNIDLNVLDKYGYTIIHRAAIHDSLDVLKYLIEKCKMNVDIPNKWGQFPQHQAAQYNSINAIKYLVNQGIGLQLWWNGNSMLHIAARYDSIDVIKYLVEDCNMNINTYNKYNETPLDCATRNKSKKVFNYLKTLH